MGNWDHSSCSLGLHFGHSNPNSACRLARVGTVTGGLTLKAFARNSMISTWLPTSTSQTKVKVLPSEVDVSIVWLVNCVMWWSVTKDRLQLCFTKPRKTFRISLELACSGVRHEQVTVLTCKKAACLMVLAQVCCGWCNGPWCWRRQCWVCHGV